MYKRIEEYQQLQKIYSMIAEGDYEGRYQDMGSFPLVQQSKKEDHDY